MSSAMRGLFRDSVLRKTGQMWKWHLSLLVMVCAGAGILAGPILGNYHLVLAATFVGSVALLFACVAIRCPTCKARWYWTALRTQPAGKWVRWLTRQSECPACRYDGSPPARGRRIES